MSAPLVVAYAFIAERLAPAGTLQGTLTAAGVTSHNGRALFSGTLPGDIVWRTGATDHRYLLLTMPSPGTDFRPNYTRILTDPEVLVRVIGRTQDDIDLDAAVTAFDVLLDGTLGTTSLGTVWYCQRHRPFALAGWTANGEPTRQLGYRYRLVVA